MANLIVPGRTTSVTLREKGAPPPPADERAKMFLYSQSVRVFSLPESQREAVERDDLPPPPLIKWGKTLFLSFWPLTPGALTFRYQIWFY
jgi:hypothetical protein